MRKILQKKFLIPGIVLLVVGFVSGGFTLIATQALAQIKTLEKIENPIARTLLARFFPNPNLLIEDHVEISCEPEFSVKAFTASALVNATFTVKDAATGVLLFGPKVVPKIDPLWQKVWLGPLSSIPPKIHVMMAAESPDGQQVNHTLIVEPDCKRAGGIVTKRVTILWPKGKLLINPFPGLTPPRPRFPPPPTYPPALPPETPRFDIPLTVAVPREAIGHNLIAVVVWRNPETGVRQYLDAQKLMDIQTEIVAFNLASVAPVASASFFDIFVELGIGEPMGPGLTRVLANHVNGLVEVHPEDSIDHPNGRRSFVADSTFDEIYFWSESLRVIDAVPLESRCPLDNDCDGVFDSSDNCPAAVNPEQADSDRDGRGDACDSCPSDSTDVCRGGDANTISSPIPAAVSGELSAQDTVIQPQYLVD